MPPGDVNARLNFNTRQFNTGLTAGQKRLEQFGESGIRIFERLNQVAQTFQNTMAGIKLPEIRPNVNITFPDASVVSYKTVLDDASVSTVGLEGATQKLGGAAGALPGPLGQAGGGARQLGDESAGASPKVDRLYDALDRLQQVGTLLVTGAGLFTFFRRIQGSADDSQSATIGLNLYRRELDKANTSGEDGMAMLERLAARFRINSTTIAQDAAGLLRYGATLSQTEEILLRAGASAVIRGRKFADGANAANEAINSEFSAALNLIGVSGNLSTFYQRLARELDTTTDALTRQQKVEAALRLLRAETQTEVEALEELYIGYSAAQQRVADQQLTASQNTGAVVIPTLTLLKNVYADLLSIYNALPRPVQALGVATVTLGVVTGALVIGYVTLRALLLNQRTLGPVILDLLKNETIARGRVGAAILAQAQAYNLLSASQLKAAQASVTSARANASTLPLLQRVLGLLKTPVRIGYLAVLVAGVREATNYLNVFAPLVDESTDSLRVLGAQVNNVVEKFGGFAEVGALFAAVFQQAVLRTVTGASLAFDELNFQYERSMLVTKKWGQQTRLDGEGAAQTQREIDALKTSHENNQKAILASSKAYDEQIVSNYLARIGMEEYASSTELAADGTRKLTAEAKELRDKFSQRLGELKPEVDTSTLKGQVTEATEELDAMIDDLKAEINKLPLGDVLRTQLEGFLKTAQGFRRAEVGKIYSAALVEAEQEASNATLGAMQEGAAKIEAQREQDKRIAEKAFKDRTAGLKTESGRYQAFLEFFNNQITAINQKADADLRADAEAKLETARGIGAEIDTLARELASQQAEGSGDTIRQLRVQFTQGAQQIRDDTKTLLRDIEQARREGSLSETQAAAETVRVQQLMTRRLQQNQEDFSRSTLREMQRRQNSVADYYSAIRTYAANYDAERLRNQGDDVGAVEVELADRLRLIDQGLRRELQQEGLTKAQITAINQKAEADRIQARLESSRQIEGIMRDETARERAFQNELRAIRQQDTIDAAQGAGLARSTANAEYQKQVDDLKASQTEELAAVGLSEDEKADIRSRHRSQREALENAHGRKIAEITEQEAEIVAAAAGEAQRARIQAIAGSLPQMIRQFGMEQAARLKVDEEALTTFEGTNQQRADIIAKNGQREVSMTRAFAAQVLREQRSALEAYESAYLTARENMIAAERQALEAREEASSAALASAQKLTDANLTGGALRFEMSAYDALRETLDQSVAANSRFVEAARQRSAVTGAAAKDVNDLIAAERQQVEAQGRVVNATQAQIDRLKTLRQQQLEVVRSGASALSVFDEVSKITGLGEVVDITPQLLKQKDVLFQLLRQQDALNAPTEERLQTIQQIGQLTERLGEKNIKLGVLDEAFLNSQALEALSSYPKQAQEALDKSAALSRDIASLQKQLGVAQTKFLGLLETVSEAAQTGLKIQLDDTAIRKELEEAQVALTEVFGTEAAERISRQFAKGFRVEEILRNEMANAANLLQAQLEQSGSASGRGFMSAFAGGIEEAGDLVEQAVLNVLRPVRELFPSSDARRGPLKDLTFSGGKTVTTYAGGIQAKLPDLKRTVMQMASIAHPLMGAPSMMNLPGLSAAGDGGGGDVHHWNFPDMYAVDDLTRMDISRAGDALMRHAKNRARMGYKPPRRGGRRF